MAKSEIQGDTWVIPKERYKNREAHAVPLTPLAKKLLQQAADYNENNPYVFPSPVAFSDPKAPKAPLDRHSLSRAVLRHLGDPEKPDDGGLALAPFTPHDLRRTVRTNLAALGVSDVIAERVMGHKLQGLLAVYNKHDYAAEKREALTKWARKLQKLAKKTEA
jgi:integrase